MKAAITGHTSGLGRAFYNALPGSIGFSRTNGYDISLEETRSRILSECKDCDLFVNNAYHFIGQPALLQELIKSNKTIINIGSNVIYYAKEMVDKFSLTEYCKSKALLNEICRGSSANIINVIPGAIDTPMIAPYPVPKMNPDDIVEFVLSLIDKPFVVREILIGVRT
jgi:hypothetical protein